jgi:hypothetical protein
MDISYHTPPGRGGRCSDPKSFLPFPAISGLLLPVRATGPVTLNSSLEIMMCGFRTLVLLMVPALGAALMTGCATEPVKTPPPPAPVIVPASSDQAMNITLDVTKLDPSAKVGSVKAVNSSAGMVAVGGIPLDAVKKGDSIQFVDGRSNCVANGTIITIDKSTDPAVPYLIVDYTPASGGRAPIKGDLAVFIPSK